MTDVENKEAQEQKVNPFEYVTIPLAEYRELVSAVATKIAKKKARKEFKKKLAEVEEDRDFYKRWYREEQEKTKVLRKNLDDAKIMIAEKLGVDPDEFLTRREEDGETDAESV